MMNSKQELFDSIDYHLMQDEKPSVYLNDIINNSIFNSDFPFILLSRLKDVQQSPLHHPEGNVWIHTLMVVDNAAKRKHLSNDAHIFMWSALLHDIGKADTTKVRKGKITSYDHERVGAKQAASFLEEFSSDKNYITKVANMIRWHMEILHAAKNMSISDIAKMKNEVPVDEIALLGLCDRLGRGGVDEETEKENVRIFLEKCNKV